MKRVALVKNDRHPQHAFARRHTAADMALLGEVHRAMGTLSRPATACVLCRQSDMGLRRARSIELVQVALKMGAISLLHRLNPW